MYIFMAPFFPSSHCLCLPNRLGSGFLADTTAALENRYHFPKSGTFIQFLLFFIFKKKSKSVSKFYTTL